MKAIGTTDEPATPADTPTELLASMMASMSRIENLVAQSQQRINQLQTIVDKLSDDVEQANNVANSAINNVDDEESLNETILTDGTIVVDSLGGDRIRIKQFHYTGMFDLYENGINTIQIHSDINQFWIGGQPVAVSDGASASMDTDIAITADVFIFLKQDRANSVVTLEKGAAVPAGTDNVDYHPIWFIKYDSANSQILHHLVVDMRDCIYGMNLVDRLSIEYVSGGTQRLKGFPASASVAIDPLTDYIVFQDADGGPLGQAMINYSNFADLAASIGPLVTVPIDNITGPSGTGNTWLYDMGITLKHDELSDIVDVTCGDDHFKTNGGGDTIISYLRNSGDAARNYMEAGSGFGDTTGAMSLSPNLRSAYDTNGTTVTLDWDNLVLAGEWGMAALNNFTIPSGNLAVTLGNVAVGTGNVTITAGELQITTGGVHVTSGGIVTDLGDIETLSGAMAATGDIESSAGAVKAYTGFFVNGVGPFIDTLIDVPDGSGGTKTIHVLGYEP